MRDKPMNIALAILATCMLVDVLAVRPHDEGAFLISIGVFGALVSRALLEDPQSLMILFLGLSLTLLAVFRNHGIIDRGSDLWYALNLLVAAVYALWERVLKWFSI